MRLTIVTPTLDRRDYLARTGETVLSQAGPFELEWVVVDGGSTDGSVDWLAAQAAADPRVKFTSAADRGQSHAINMGMASATGDVVAWLNADDLYAPGALAAVAEAFASNPAVQWLVGRYEVIDAQDVPIRQSIVRYKWRRLSGGLSRRQLLRENVVPQPAVFWRREFSRRVGPIDESLHWTMDYDLWLRMAAQSTPLIVDRLLARFRHHEASKSGAFDRRQFDEGYAVARRHADGDGASLIAHRVNVEKIVWGYRVLRMLGR